MMVPIVVALPDDLKAFLDAEVAAKGHASAGAYLCALLEDARTKAVSARLETLLLEGLAGELLPLGAVLQDRPDVTPGSQSEPPNHQAVGQTVFVRQGAKCDILHEYDRYVAQGMPAIARRFLNALARAADAALATPNAGAACQVGATELAGVRNWPMKGFSEHRLYADQQADRLTILRVLHDKRHIAGHISARREAE
jgi:plasmid stabilization system protein ParE